MMRFVFIYSLAALLASAALAAPPAEPSDGAIAAAVEREFLGPYVAWQAEYGEFSRAEKPSSTMRVRVLGESQKDAEGAAFVPFAIDTRHADGEWESAQMTGCVYLESSAVSVTRGNEFRAAADYFAQKAGKPRAASVCVR